MKLVWLFREHRELNDAYQELRRSAEKTADWGLKLQEDNKRLADALEKAQQYIQSNPGYINNIMDLLQKYQETVLQEAPLPKNYQPEWLTPGEDIPIKDSE